MSDKLEDALAEKLRPLAVGEKFITLRAETLYDHLRTCLMQTIEEMASQTNTIGLLSADERTRHRLRIKEFESTAHRKLLFEALRLDHEVIKLITAP